MFICSQLALRALEMKIEKSQSKGNRPLAFRSIHLNSLEPSVSSDLVFVANRSLKLANHAII